jgi:hypothetical protein
MIPSALLLIVLCQNPSDPPPRRPWALTMDAVRTLAVPQAVRDLALDDLEYNEGDSVKGIVVDLNGDGHRDYLIQSAPSLCGNGGCVYLVVDGRSERGIGQIFGEPLYFLAQASHGYPTIASYAHLSAAARTYTTWSYTGKEYRQVGSRTVEGGTRDTLLASLRRIPFWPARKSPRP